MNAIDKHFYLKKVAKRIEPGGRMRVSRQFAQHPPSHGQVQATTGMSEWFMCDLTKKSCMRRFTFICGSGNIICAQLLRCANLHSSCLRHRRRRHVRLWWRSSLIHTQLSLKINSSGWFQRVKLERERTGRRRHHRCCCCSSHSPQSNALAACRKWHSPPINKDDGRSIRR